VDTKVMRMDGEDRIIYTVQQTGETFTDRKKAEMAALEAARNQPARRLLAVGAPRVGDVRVSFSELSCHTVTVLAKQKDTVLVPWESSQGSGYNIAILQSGSVSASDMISGAQSENTIWTWVKRVVGWLLCFIGFGMITSIISTVADISLNWIPFLGPMAASIIDLGVSIANFILSISISVIVAGLAWVYYRPVLGLTLLACAGGLLFMSSKAGASKKANQKPA